MKPIYKTLTACICIIASLCPFVLAEDYTNYADELFELGLFNGTDKGYELDKPLTRAEGATMLVRLLGEGDNVDEYEYWEVFEDVTSEHWSYPYVMYCYENDITKGTGEYSFSPDLNIDAREFVTLVLRSLKYEAEPENAYDIAVNKGLFGTEFVRTLEGNDEFLRNEMVYIAYRSLKTKTADGNVLAEVLAKKGVLDESQAKKFNIFELKDINDFIDEYLK